MAAPIEVEFDAATQNLEALQAAAYRLIGTASCLIKSDKGRFVCHLTPTAIPEKAVQHSAEQLQQQFIHLVTDENLREIVARRTDRVRDVILSLAFGALANDHTSNR